MSWLLPLPIRGAGTARVEALSSYLLRLAHVHATAPGTYISSIVERHCWPDLPRRVGILQSGISALIRPNDSTLLVLEALASGLSMALSDLEQTTFVSLSSALNRPQKAFSPRLRWCPACLVEQTKNGSDAYFELAWQVLATETCDVHNVRLRDRCSSCGGAQDSFQLRKTLAACVHCGASLGKTNVGDIKRDLYSSDVRALVGHIAANPGLRFPQHGVSGVLRSLLDEAWHQANEDELYRILPRDECIRLSDPEAPLTLISALRIAFWLNVPLTDLLLGQLRGTNRSIFGGTNERLPAVIAPQHRRRIRSVETLATNMSCIVETSSEALPLREIAGKLGVSVGALRYHLPEQSIEVSRAYLLGRRQRHTSISMQCRASVENAIERWSSLESQPLSRKRLLITLRAETDLPKNVLREEIQRQTTSTTAATNQRGVK